MTGAVSSRQVAAAEGRGEQRMVSSRRLGRWHSRAWSFSSGGEADLRSGSSPAAAPVLRKMRSSQWPWSRSSSFKGLSSFGAQKPMGEENGEHLEKPLDFLVKDLIAQNQDLRAAQAEMAQKLQWEKKSHKVASIEVLRLRRELEVAQQRLAGVGGAERVIGELSSSSIATSPGVSRERQREGWPAEVASADKANDAPAWRRMCGWRSVDMADSTTQLLGERMNAAPRNLHSASAGEVAAVLGPAATLMSGEQNGKLGKGSADTEREVLAQAELARDALCSYYLSVVTLTTATPAVDASSGYGDSREIQRLREKLQGVNAQAWFLSLLSRLIFHGFESDTLGMEVAASGKENVAQDGSAAGEHLKEAATDSQWEKMYVESLSTSEQATKVQAEKAALFSELAAMDALPAVSAVAELRQYCLQRMRTLKQYLAKRFNLSDANARDLLLGQEQLKSFAVAAKAVFTLHTLSRSLAAPAYLIKPRRDDLFSIHTCEEWQPVRRLSAPRRVANGLQGCQVALSVLPGLGMGAQALQKCLVCTY